MKQVQVHRYGGPEVMQILDAETPGIGDWELLVQVKYASANPKDIFLRKGKMKSYLSISFPVKLGQDFSGVVAAVGKKAGPFRPGDRVFGMVNQSNNGTLSEYIAVTPNEIWYAPENLNFAEAAAVPLAAQTALQALQTIAKIKPGQRVCINGASGGVGTFAVQVARISGAHVTAISSEKNHALCRELGADEVVDYKTTPPEKMQGSFDVFFDVFGNQSRPKVRHLLRKDSWYISTVPNFRNIRDTVLALMKMSKSRLVVVESDSEDLKILKKWIEAGDLKPVLEAEFPMHRIAEVHQRIETKRTVGKIVVQIG
ncbi:MAG: NAD(P)-dependent alcohol dehydrogenase [Lewinellaceae bacterium]|nr:NAD(P)-dependent alcohol dehydrogenase [Saprospiraceae bacterium]MCB9339776.1 NAD(P)-dependent alcohol dehydrogenase [Lewinellaceae bacterium]